MKRILTLSILCFAAVAMFAQPALKVADTGNVGINEDTPLALVHVASKGSTSTMYAGYNQAGQQLFGVKEGGTGNGNFFVLNSGGTRTIQFASAGQFYINTGNNMSIGATTGSGNTLDVIGTAGKTTGEMWTNTSDKRSKKNINSYQGGLAELMQINPVTFQYNGKFGTPNDGVTRVGVLAQEMQKVLPRTVSKAVRNFATLEESESPDYKSADYEEEFLAVNASEVLWTLVNATKEQQTLIEELKKENQELRELISSVRDGIGAHDIEATIEGIDGAASLSQNKPNPFSTQTSIEYFVPASATSAEIRVLANDGRLVKTIAITDKGQGTLSLDAINVPVGNYFYSLNIDGKKIDTKKMVIAN